MSLEISIKQEHEDQDLVVFEIVEDGEHREQTIDGLKQRIADLQDVSAELEDGFDKEKVDAKIIKLQEFQGVLEAELP
jgi:TolA-binding protein